MLYFYFGHHKAATTNIASIVQNFSSHLGLRSEIINTPLQLNRSLAQYVLNQNKSFLCYINAVPQSVNQITMPFRGFHVIRDPRDCIVSAYYSHRNTHSTVEWPELVEHRNNLLSLTLEEGIIAEIAFSKLLLTNGYPISPFTSMEEWNYNSPNILELRYENMINDYAEFFLTIFQFLHLIPEKNARRFLGRLRRTFNHQALLKILNSNSFSTLADGRLPGIANDSSHYRKGISGDYLNHFTPRIKEKFIEAFPNILQKLNYEASVDW